MYKFGKYANVKREQVQYDTVRLLNKIDIYTNIHYRSKVFYLFTY